MGWMFASLLVISCVIVITEIAVRKERGKRR